MHASGQQRALIVLLATEGLQNKDIAERVGLDRHQVSLWQERFLDGGTDALRMHSPRSRRPATTTAAPRVVRTFPSFQQLTRAPASDAGGQSRKLNRRARHVIANLSSALLMRYQPTRCAVETPPTALSARMTGTLIWDGLVRVVKRRMSSSLLSRGCRDHIRAATPEARALAPEVPPSVMTWFAPKPVVS